MHTRKLTAPALILTAFLASWLIQGCYNDPGPRDGSIEVNTTLLMEDGTNPVWLPDGSGMLAAYRAGMEEVGIYRMSLDATAPELVYEGPHNHDYTVSADGARFAFSVPGDEAGVRVVEFGGDTTSVLPGGRNPQLIDVSGTLKVVAENGEGDIVVVDAASGDVDYVLVTGSHPKAAPGSPYVGYLHPSVRGGFRLRAIHVGGAETEIPLIEDEYVGSDFVWAPNGQDLFASVLVDSTLSQIVQCNLEMPNSYEPLLSSALQPAVTSDGSTMLASHLSGAVSDYVVYFDLTTSAESRFIDDGRDVVCSPVNEREALFSNDEGIWLAEW